MLDETAPGFLGLYIGALSEEPVRAAVEGADVVIGPACGSPTSAQAGPPHDWRS
ncbi:MAG TPA: hypothetical protein VGP05_17850 [Pseudonocardia sp.]|nr:hypothetical protein [Pseudonocardia sp.]